MAMDLLEEHRRGIGWLVTGVAVTALTVGTLYLSVLFAGIVNTVVYAFLFLMGLTFMPVSILLFAPSFPGMVKSGFGKLHFILGQFAFGYGYLVQTDKKWLICPGDEETVFIEGEWYDIEDGFTNLSILGWQPFGIIRFKDKETLQAYRVDPAASIGKKAQADGGETAVERGGFKEVSPDATVSGLDGEWLVDLKRLYSRGLKKFGDIELIEKAEEVMMRDEAKGSKVDGYETIIATGFGLVMGVGMAYVMVVPGG